MGKLIRLYAISVLIFLYAPVTVLVLYSFNSSRYGINFEGFSLSWYKQLFRDDATLTALMHSVCVAFSASIIALTVSVPLAYLFYRKKLKVRKPVENVVKMTLVIPDISLAIGLAFLFQLLRFSLGLHTIILSHVVFSIAFSFLIISARFKVLDPTLEDAAKDLGATGWQTFSRIILPNIWPNILASFFVCFTLSWDDFIFSFFASSAGKTTLPVHLFAMIKKGINPEINAIATVSMILSLVFIYASLRFQKLLNTLNSMI